MTAHCPKHSKAWHTFLSPPPHVHRVAEHRCVQGFFSGRGESTTWRPRSAFTPQDNKLSAPSDREHCVKKTIYITDVDQQVFSYYHASANWSPFCERKVVDDGSDCCLLAVWQYNLHGNISLCLLFKDAVTASCSNTECVYGRHSSHATFKTGRRQPITESL